MQERDRKRQIDTLKKGEIKREIEAEIVNEGEVGSKCVLFFKYRGAENIPWSLYTVSLSCSISLFLSLSLCPIFLSPSLLALAASAPSTICSTLCVIETFATQFMPIFIGTLNNSHFLISQKQKTVFSLLPSLSLSLCFCFVRL